MRLFIAEKPSLGRAIANALPGPQQKGEGFIKCGTDTLVSWCIGHLLEQVEPDAYDPVFKAWRFEHLPIVPREWQLQPKANTRKQLTVLKKLVKEADELIHAGDPDREGQLLVDEVIAWLKVAPQKRAKVQRCLISDLNPDAVRRALAQLKPNQGFVPLSTSALARSRADWLYGINLTRACTLQGQKSGYQGVLSVGRVQTPILGLVVRRDDAIAAFVSKPFYEVLANLQTEAGEHFQAKWQPSEACAAYQDEEGRVVSKALAENVVRRITGQPAHITQLTRKTKQQPPPLPYSLSSLQIDAGKRYGMSAQQVLDVCQSLYEKHTLITYPRSDSRYLPEEHYERAPRVMQAIRNTCSSLVEAVEGADPNLRSKAWNDKKVDAHHAIIPTEKQANGTRLSTDEQRLYELIARQYLLQFYPNWRYLDTEVMLDIVGGSFIARARETVENGWKVLFPSRSSDDEGGSEGLQSALPPLQQGQVLQCLSGELQEKMTQPPKHFTDATLLAAITGIARYVKDPDIRKILRETDGLGTEATRAGIIELLFKRHFLMRQGKQILATLAGKALIHSLPESTTLPDMTAEWEARLNAISQREDSYQAFMQSLEATLGDLIGQVGQTTVKVPVSTETRQKRKGVRRSRKNTTKK
ncbi:DNA topoisomerase III [Nitrincola alkalisediminis]|uniref:DNA topoisomerase III n=1 Tax=Nitrincola alkalisediminis TaxID=1366656 RepID=UPI001875DEDF|nr:DNA topoisomerase III [Nitrincola alkalisediminis]